MRFGCHNYIFTDHWDDDSLPILEQAAELGLTCFEIAIGDDVQFATVPLRRRAKTLGLELVVSPGALWPMPCDISSDDPDERQIGLDWHKRQIDLAHELGAVAYTGALYGHPGIVKRRQPPPEEFERIAAGLHEMAAYAQAHQVAIALEPMSHFRTHLVNTPEQAMRLIEMSDHKNLHVLLDTYHMVTEVRDYAAAVETVAPRLWGVHACENDRGVPGGGLIPWEDFCKALNAVGFDGYVLMETYNSGIGDFAHERGMFHNVCPDGAAFIRRGLSFLKSVL